MFQYLSQRYSSPNFSERKKQVKFICLLAFLQILIQVEGMVWSRSQEPLSENEPEFPPWIFLELEHACKSIRANRNDKTQNDRVIDLIIMQLTIYHVKGTEWPMKAYHDFVDRLLEIFILEDEHELSEMGAWIRVTTQGLIQRWSGFALGQDDHFYSLWKTGLEDIYWAAMFLCVVYMKTKQKPTPFCSSGQSCILSWAFPCPPSSIRFSL